MATASVEIGPISDRGNNSFHGRCVRQESLTISGSTATLATAVTADEAGGGAVLSRLSVDTDCYFALGTTPDPTATAATAATTARRLLCAGCWIDVLLAVGEKMAVKATS